MNMVITPRRAKEASVQEMVFRKLNACARQRRWLFSRKKLSQVSNVSRPPFGRFSVDNYIKDKLKAKKLWRTSLRTTLMKSRL